MDVPFAHRRPKKPYLKCEQEPVERHKYFERRVVSILLTGDKTWHSHREELIINSELKQKDQNIPCITKRTQSSIMLLYGFFFRSSGLMLIECLSTWSYSRWAILQEHCTEDRVRVLQ